MPVGGALAQILSVLAPPACLACRAPLVAADVLCAACRGVLPWVRDPCPRCALPLAPPGGSASGSAARCPACPARGAAFSSAWAPVAHAGPARELVLALKLGGALPAAGAMAAPMAARLRAPRAAFAPADAVLVPVPPAPDRLRRRGFDPAAAIADALAARVERPLDPGLLRRTGPARRQVGRGRGARRAAPRVEAARHPGRRAVPRSVVLVDDVHTTGATLDACARALREAGCVQVVALTYARTLRGA